MSDRLVPWHEPKVAATLAEWDYTGPCQPEPGGCVRCGAWCCETHLIEEGAYQCNGHCDARAVHPPENLDAPTPDQVAAIEANERALLARLKRKYEGTGP